MENPAADQILAASWASDPDGGCAYIDPVWSKFAGQMSEQAPSGWMGVVHPRDQSRVEASWKSAFAVRAPYRVECRLRRVDGVYRRAFVRAAPHVDRTGVFFGYIGSIVDIEAHLSVLEALKESEERFRTLVESHAQAVWQRDAEGAAVEDSPRWRAYTGQTLDEYLGHGWLGAVHPDDRPDAEDKWREALSTRSNYEAEHRLKWKGGGWHWTKVRGAPLLDDDGSIKKWVGVNIDINARKLAQRALRDNERFMRLVQDAANAGCWDWSLSDNRNVWSMNLWALYGLELGACEPSYDCWTASIHEDDRECVLGAISAAMRAGEGFEVQWRVNLPEGRPTRWLMSRGRPVLDPKGVPERYIGIVLDITDRKNAEDALREADRRKDEFIAMLAHELRNPLVPIHNGVHVLKARAMMDGEESHRPLIEMMERQVTHLVRLVDDLLEISRIAGGRIELRKEPVDLLGVLSEALEASRLSIENAPHCMGLVTPSEALCVDGDPVRLGQVFANILNNAAKYTPAGGRIDIEAERRENEAVVTVRDNGHGIGPESLPHVFELFSRGDRPGDGGLGIGLALVRQLVELHGGSVEAVSEGLGHGSAFIVRLPLGAVAAQGRERAEWAEAPAPADRRALVIDDDRDVADSLAMLLEGLGATVRVTYAGREGLREIEAFEPHIVFLDLGMPEQDGIQTARMIRQSDIGRKLTLVALTGWGQAEDRARTRDAGFDAHLTKPASVRNLRRLLGDIGGR
jgi:PAS domain S-box-containing protein